MTFNLKTIAAAVALAVVSAGANASIQGASATGGSELVFYAFDTTDPFATPSFVMDLGITYDQFASAKTFGSAGSNNVFNTTQWGQYKTAVGNNLSSTVWGVFAAKATGTDLTVSGSFQALTTAAKLPTPLTTGASTSARTTLNNFSAVSAVFGGFVGALGDVSATAVNNAYFSPASELGQSNWGQAMFDRMGGKLGTNFGSTGNAVNTDSNMYRIVNTRAGTTGALATTASLSDVLTLSSDGYQWQFDGNTVWATAAPIPEPETYALMAAGLALVGGIARRRRSRA